MKMYKINYFNKLWLAMGVAFSRPASFKIDNMYLVTIVVPPGAVPQHLTLNEALTAIETALTHGTGEIQVGNVTLDVTAI